MFRLLSTEEFPLWTAFLAAQNPAYPFSTIEYASCYQQHLGGDFKVLVAEAEGEIEGGIVLFEKLKWKQLMATTPICTPYSGIVLSDKALLENPERENVLSTKLVSEVGKRYAKCDIIQYPNLFDARMFSWQNWQVSPRYTYLTKPSSYADLYENLSKSRKYDIRKAEKRVQFSSFTDAQILAELVAASYKRQQKALSMPTQTLSKWLNALEKQGMVRFFGISPLDSTQINSAVAVFQDYKGNCYHFFAGSQTKDANLYLNMRILDQLFAEDVQCYDFCGANVQSIAAFKSLTQPTLSLYFHSLFYQKKWLKGIDAFR